MRVYSALQVFVLFGNFTPAVTVPGAVLRGEPHQLFLVAAKAFERISRCVKIS